MAMDIVINRTAPSGLTKVEWTFKLMDNFIVLTQCYEYTRATEKDKFVISNMPDAFLAETESVCKPEIIILLGEYVQLPYLSVVILTCNPSGLMFNDKSLFGNAVPLKTALLFSLCSRIPIEIILVRLKQGHSIKEVHEMYPWVPMKTLKGAIDEITHYVIKTLHA